MKPPMFVKMTMSVSIPLDHEVRLVIKFLTAEDSATEIRKRLCQVQLAMSSVN